jgi:hypothetical protein
MQLVLPTRSAALGSRYHFEVDATALSFLSEQGRRELFERTVLRFPGFREESRLISKNAQVLSFVGYVQQPGFVPVELEWKWLGQNFYLRDFAFVNGSHPSDKGAFRHHGYYVFLNQKGLRDNQRISAWGLQDWKTLICWMAEYGADELWVMLNFLWHAYPSEKYPELVDNGCQNVRAEFLNDLIDFAHERGVRIFLAYACEDCLQGYNEKHPEFRCIDRFGHPYNSCCLEMPPVRKYLMDTVQETLLRYPKADGIAIHPNEEGYERFNPQTAELFERETRQKLHEASDQERLNWYARQASQLTAEMYGCAKKVRPGIECVAFNVHWLDDYADVFIRELPTEIKICVWQYPHHGNALENQKLFKWRKQLAPDRLIYMPNGFSYRAPSTPQANWLRHTANDCLLSAAHALGYQSCIYYVHFELWSEDDRLRDLVMAKYPSKLKFESIDELAIQLGQLYQNYIRMKMMGC